MATLNRPTWSKSSYSSQSGGNCVETAVLWRKSTHSSQSGGECLEAATAGGVVGVRDSKELRHGHLGIPRGSWFALTEALKR